MGGLGLAGDQDAGVLPGRKREQLAGDQVAGELLVMGSFRLSFAS